MEPITFKTIPNKFPQINYAVDIAWSELERNIERFITQYDLQMNPDFQRGNVWTPSQQSRYVEFMLKGGESGKSIYFNHPGWMKSFKGDFVLVDGLQRITAVRAFLKNEIKAYDRTYSQLLEGMPYDRAPYDYGFKFHVATLRTRAEVLQWYLDFNSGGTVHAQSEIERVKELLSKELPK